MIGSKVGFPADPESAAAVADGRRLVDLYERLGSAGSARVFAADLGRVSLFE
ncbi:MAG: hypothetical protein ACT4QF_01075 [Sporichthyaceae bacterium]